MSGMSTYLANSVINATLRNISYTSPATVYLALFLNDPTDNNSGGEINAPSYVRQPILISAPVNGVASNLTSVIFDASTTNWGTINYIGIYDAVTGGNLLYSDALTTPQTININQIFRMYAGDLTITLL
jgi:hypothetical protein